MPAAPAAGLAALDLLFQQRRIFVNDHRAGREFAFLAERRMTRFYRPLYIAAVDALDRSGGRSAVEAIVLGGHAPRSPAVLSQAENGFHALAEHFLGQGMIS